MIPKEKANKLIKEYKEIIWGLGYNEFCEVSVKLAIKNVEEIISACEYNHVEHNNIDWWNKVKEEIIAYDRTL